jgi:hypothetical protein
MSTQKPNFSSSENGRNLADSSSVESVTKSVHNGIASAITMPKKLMETQLDVGAELLAFMGRRMKAQADLWSSLGHCSDLSEATNMQKCFIEKVTKDYTEEATQLSDIARKNLEVVAGLASSEVNKATSEASNIRARM